MIEWDDSMFMTTSFGFIGVVKSFDITISDIWDDSLPHSVDICKFYNHGTENMTKENIISYELSGLKTNKKNLRKILTEAKKKVVSYERKRKIKKVLNRE